jgi:hypothetical protein
MYNTARRFGAAPSMPDPSTKKPDDDSKVEKVSEAIAADTLSPIMEENIKPADQKESSVKDEKPVKDAAAAMAEALKDPGPNIRPVEFKDAVSTKSESSESGQINVVNANGIVSGVKLVNGMWRTLSVAFMIVILVLVAGLVYTFLKYDDANVHYREAVVVGNAASSNLNTLYAELGASNQEEAVFAASFGDTLDGAALASLKEALVAKVGELNIDYTKDDFNSVQRTNGYRVVKLVINNKKYVAYAKSDNVWTVLEFVETLHDRCEGFSDEARLVVDNVLRCIEN